MASKKRDKGPSGKYLKLVPKHQVFDPVRTNPFLLKTVAELVSRLERDFKGRQKVRYNLPLPSNEFASLVALMWDALPEAKELPMPSSNFPPFPPNPLGKRWGVFIQYSRLLKALFIEYEERASRSKEDGFSIDTDLNKLGIALNKIVLRVEGPAAANYSYKYRTIQFSTSEQEELRRNQTFIAACFDDSTAEAEIDFRRRLVKANNALVTVYELLSKRTNKHIYGVQKERSLALNSILKKHSLEETLRVLKAIRLGCSAWRKDLKKDKSANATSEAKAKDLDRFILILDNLMREIRKAFRKKPNLQKKPESNYHEYDYWDITDGYARRLRTTQNGL